MVDEMLVNYKRSVIESFIVSLLLIVFAFVLLYNPENFMESAINMFGYIGFFLGVLDIVIYFKTNKENRIYKNNLQTGTILLCASIIAFFKTSVIKEFIAFILGGYLIYRGSVRTDLSVKLKDYNIRVGIILLILAIINMILGILMILNPFTSLIKLNELIAILVLINECIYIIENIILLVMFKKIKNN